MFNRIISFYKKSQPSPTQFCDDEASRNKYLNKLQWSRWFPLKRRGTFYGFFSASHNLGEFLSFVFVGSLVGFFGWQMGFLGASLAGALGVVLICF